MGVQLVLSREQNESRLPLTEAYGRIVDVQVSADREEAAIHVAIYGDKAARDANGASLLKKTVWVKASDLTPANLTKDALKKAAWEYLMSRTVQFGEIHDPDGKKKIEINFTEGTPVL